MQTNANLVCNTQSESTSISWFLDIGANQDVTLNNVNMTISGPYNDTDQFHFRDGKGLAISQIAHSKINAPQCTFNLSNILHVPYIKKHLLYVQKFFFRK